MEGVMAPLDEHKEAIGDTNVAAIVTSIDPFRKQHRKT